MELNGIEYFFTVPLRPKPTQRGKGGGGGRVGGRITQSTAQVRTDNLGLNWPPGFVVVVVVVVLVIVQSYRCCFVACRLSVLSLQYSLIYQFGFGK